MFSRLAHRRAERRQDKIDARADALEKNPVGKNSRPVPNDQFSIVMLDYDESTKRRNEVTVRASSQEGLDQLIKDRIAKKWQIKA